MADPSLTRLPFLTDIAVMAISQFIEECWVDNPQTVQIDKIDRRYQASKHKRSSDFDGVDLIDESKIFSVDVRNSNCAHQHWRSNQL